ncbi:ABC transporter permease [Shinella sp. BYT-45]|uniref:ABC transporter permease n=1 Tax=Shinella sp. BYT-45 TaxID=3377377 RepID=UPI00398146DB
MILSKPMAGRLASGVFILAVAVLILGPVVRLAGTAVMPSGSFGLDLAYEVLANADTMQALINTVVYVVGVSLLSVLVGTPLAFLTERTDISDLAKKVIRLSIVSSLITPAFLVAMAYVNLLGPNAGLINVLLRNLLGLTADRGPLNVYNMGGVLFLGALNSIAFVYLITSAAFSRMNPELEEAAAISGVGRARIIATVTLPVARNSIFAGGMLAMAGALADYGTPHMVNFTVLTLRIRSYMIEANFAAASVVSLLLVVLSLIVLAIYRRSEARNSVATVTGKSFAARPFPIGRARHLLAAVAYLYAFLAVVLPLTGLAFTSLLDRLGGGISLDNFTLRHYRDIIFGDALVVRAVTNSLILSVATAAVCAVMAVFAAYIIVRRRSSLLDYIVVIPLGLAGTALAVALVMTVTGFPLRSLGLYGTLWIILLAYVIRHLPLAVRPTQAGLTQIAPELEEASRLSGASWARTLYSVLLPLLRPSLAAASVIVFLTTLTELSASIIVRHIGTDTIATAIMDLWDGGGGYQRASAVAICVFVVMLLIVIVAQSMTSRSLFGQQEHS